MFSNRACKTVDFSRSNGSKRHPLRNPFPGSADFKAIILWIGYQFVLNVMISFYLFRAPDISIMSCLSIHLFTVSTAFFKWWDAQQKHNQTLQSVSVVSVLEQENKKKIEETGENWRGDGRENVHFERVWNTSTHCSRGSVSCETVMTYRLQLSRCPLLHSFLSTVCVGRESPCPFLVCLGSRPKITLCVRNSSFLQWSQ